MFLSFRLAEIGRKGTGADPATPTLTILALNFEAGHGRQPGGAHALACVQASLGATHWANRAADAFDMLSLRFR